MKGLVSLTIMPIFQPGDLPPKGYLEWHEWAEVQRKAGIKQVECGGCGKYKTPQELTGHLRVTEAKDKKGNVVFIREPICNECFFYIQPPHGETT